MGNNGKDVIGLKRNNFESTLLLLPLITYNMALEQILEDYLERKYFFPDRNEFVLLDWKKKVDIGKGISLRSLHFDRYFL